MTANSRVCSKHFYESDFKEKCEDSNVSRAKNKTLTLRRLKSDSFPKVFENQPSYLTVKETNHRSTSSSSSKRVEQENRRYIELEENILLAETITDFSDFEAKMSTCFVPCGYEIFKRKDFYSFVYINIDDEYPTIKASVKIDSDLTIKVSYKGASIKEKHFAHVLSKTGCISLISEVTNVLAVVKGWIESKSKVTSAKQCLMFVVNILKGKLTAFVIIVFSN